MSQLKINPHDPASAEILKYINRRINELREDNDEALGKAETATIRGQIKSFKELADLARTEKDIPMIQPTNYLD